MGTIAVTGSASGIGAATAERLRADHHDVIGIDLRDADVVADLSVADGRAAMLEGVADRCGGRLDGLVVAAGVNGSDGAQIVAVNHFGAVATLEGLRPFLAAAGSASAVAISSNSATTQPGLPTSVTLRCLAGDEFAAKELAATDALTAYGASKLALARWIRREAPTASWLGCGIRLNAIAPGFVETPMTAGQWDFISGLGDVYPMPAGRPGRPEEIAGVIAFLLGPDATYLCGSVLVVDGGTEAARRPDDWPAPLA